MKKIIGEVIVREVTVRDLPALARIDSEVFGCRSYKDSLKKMTLVFKIRVPSAALVAEHCGRIIGLVFAENIPEETIKRARIRSVFVVKEWRRKGIAKMLMTRAVAALSKQKFETVSLLVAPKNKKARRLYRQNGFRLFRYMLVKRL